MVGSVMLEVLAEQQFPFTELLLVASENSVGKKITYQGKEYAVIGLADAVAAAPDIAIFSAGGDTSLQWAPRFAEKGTVRRRSKNHPGSQLPAGAQKPATH